MGLLCKSPEIRLFPKLSCSSESPESSQKYTFPGPSIKRFQFFRSGMRLENLYTQIFSGDFFYDPANLESIYCMLSAL